MSGNGFFRDVMVGVVSVILAVIVMHWLRIRQ